MQCIKVILLDSIFITTQIFGVTVVCLSTSLPVPSNDSKAASRSVQTYHAGFICELAHPFRQDLVDVPVFLKEAGFVHSLRSSQQNILSALWI